MLTLFELETGQLFRWQNAIYQFLRIDDQDGRTLHIADLWGDNDWRIMKVPYEENFNPYCHVQPVKVTYTNI